MLQEWIWTGLKLEPKDNILQFIWPYYMCNLTMMPVEMARGVFMVILMVVGVRVRASVRLTADVTV